MTESQVMKAVNNLMSNGDSMSAGSQEENKKHAGTPTVSGNNVEADAAGIAPGGDALSAATALPVLFNALFVRRAVVPAANGHFSARALARYYAMLAAGGQVPAMSSVTEPALGSHPHIPALSSTPPTTKKDVQESGSTGDDSRVQILNMSEEKLFVNPGLLDAVLGTGEYSKYVVEGPFGLGFMRLPCEASEIPSAPIPFGHSGLGGSTAFCDVEHNFAIAVTLNKMNMGDVASEIVRFVCKGLDIPCPLRFAEGGKRGVDMTLDLAQ